MMSLESRPFTRSRPPPVLHVREPRPSAPPMGSFDYPARVRSSETLPSAHHGWSGRFVDSSHLLGYGDGGGSATLVDLAGTLLLALLVAYALAVASKYASSGGEGSRSWGRT